MSEELNNNQNPNENGAEEIKNETNSEIKENVSETPVSNTTEPNYQAANGSTYSPYAAYNRPTQEQPQAQNQNAFNNQSYGQSASYYGGAPNYYQNYQAAPNKKVKKEKKKGKAAIVWLIVACIIFATISGVVTGVLIYKSSHDTVTDKAPQSDRATLSEDDTADTEAPKINYKKGEVVNDKKSDGSIASAAEICCDSVVEITTEAISTNAFYRQYITSGAGSGVIIDTAGYIVTCAHVVEDATTITVTLRDGSTTAAKLIGSDSQTDIAVIKIEADNLVAAKIGDSDSVIVGETAIAVGNPLGQLGGTVTSGIISALNREITIDGQTYTLLQTDASINPGNSGGGLFDIDGNLIGIVNAKSGASSMSGTTIEGLGFAIPINDAIEVATQLTAQGYVGGRAVLGITVCEVDSSTNTTSLYLSGNVDLIQYIKDYGVYFTGYVDGQNGDLKYGDRIIAINDISVSSRADVKSVIKDYSVGDTISITVSRLNSDGRQSQVVDVSLTLVEDTSQVTDSSESAGNQQIPEDTQQQQVPDLADLFNGIFGY